MDTETHESLDAVGASEPKQSNRMLEFANLAAYVGDRHFLISILKDEIDQAYKRMRVIKDENAAQPEVEHSDAG